MLNEVHDGSDAFLEIDTGFVYPLEFRCGKVMFENWGLVLNSPLRDERREVAEGVDSKFEIQ